MAHKRRMQLYALLLLLAGILIIIPEVPILNCEAQKEEQQTNISNSSAKKCQYLRSEWSNCNANGMQRRTLRLKNSNSSLNSNKCELKRTLRRECRTGCKYQRGQWMPQCKGRWRFRLDTLIGPVGLPLSGGAVSNTTGGTSGRHTCANQRRVMKDCRRVCHYNRSAWSNCSSQRAGFMERNLTLVYGEKSCKRLRIDQRPC